MMLIRLAFVLLQSDASDRPLVAPMFGSFVRSAGDIDGDGSADILIGDEGWRSSGNPAAWWILSGSEFHELHAFHADELGDRMPVGLLPAGDVDADGHGDLLLVHRGSSEDQPGTVHLWSGRSRAITRSATPDERERASASTLFDRRIGDLDGDGSLEYVERSADTQGSIVALHSDATPSAVWHLHREAAQVIACDDVDADGWKDVLCAQPQSGVAQGVVECLSGADGKPLWHAEDTRYWYFGWAIDVIGDIDRDGLRDWIVGGSNHRSHEPGAASIHSGRHGALLVRLERAGRAVEVTLCQGLKARWGK